MAMRACKKSHMEINGSKTLTWLLGWRRSRLIYIPMWRAPCENYRMFDCLKKSIEFGQQPY
jgi:hypothetical protein